MFKIVTSIALLLTFLLQGSPLTGKALAMESETMAALVYPSGAQIQVEKTLPVQGNQVTFDLPAGALTETLILNAQGSTIARWESKPVAGQDSPSVKALKEELLQAEKNLAVVAGEIAATKAKVQLWSLGIEGSKTSDAIRFGNVAEIEKLDAMMSARLSPLYVQLVTLEPQYRELAQQVELLRQELARQGEAGVQTRITVFLSDKPQTPTIRLQYTCAMTGCGWRPLYRLDALPGKDLIHFTQEAEIWQGTGQPWTHVDLTLMSDNPEQALTPQELAAWRMRLLPSTPAPMPKARVAMMAAPMSLESNLDNAVQQQTEGTTRTTWHLGARDIPAGSPVYLGLERNDWNATFVRVVRPSVPTVNKAAYLQADVKLPEAKEFPQGRAQYFVDGMPVGTALFAMTGQEKTLYFGTDARVVSEMKLDRHRSGQKGVLDKQQTKVWSWRIKVTNNHTTPVAVLVEDPAPQQMADDIKVNVVSTPQPQTKDHVFQWTQTIPAGKSFDISHMVEASAPQGQRFDDGRPE